MRNQSSLNGLLSLGLTVAFCGIASAQVAGYWRFDEKAPGNVAATNAGDILDTSGNGRHGTAEAGMIYSPGSAAYGNASALTFNVGSDHVTVPDAAGAFNFSPSQSVTLEALIRTYNIGQDSVGAIMNKQVASPGEWWWRINANGRQQFWLDDGTGNTKNVNGARSLNDGQWHHVAAVFDSAAQQVRVYVDYALDGSAAAVYSTAGTIGNTNDLILGAFNAGNRQFDGEMDFARITLAALDPADFVPPNTSIVNLSPTNDATFLSASTTASFAIKSPVVGVDVTNIVVTINGTNISSQLGFAGNNNDRTVTLPALAANTYYRVNLAVTDLTGGQIARNWVFNTFENNLFFIEAEDYNFENGQFLDNPQLSGAPGPSNYLDRLGVEGVDYHQTNTPTLAQYRIGDQVGTAITTDPLRQNYLDAQVLDPGISDYMTRDHANTEWLNYTRTFPAGTYRVYARLAKPGTVPVVMQLDEVTGGSTTPTQTLAPLGRIQRVPTGSDQDYEFVALTSATGNEVALPLTGVHTFRLTMLSGGANVSLNYLVFVPVTGAQAPFLVSVNPAANAGNEASTASLQAEIRNADTTVVTGSIQLRLDGTNVNATVVPTATGATVNFTPSLMATGAHTAAVIFADSAAATVTNQWSFYVANRAVRGYWKFNEQTPGNFASTATNAIRDDSGNARHGTANVGAMPYVTGSFNYGNTAALRFSPGADRVVVPDSAGNFSFTNSFTFEALVRSTNTGTSAAILAKNGLGDAEGEFWWRFPGAAGGQQRIGFNNQLFLGGTNKLNDGAWHHLAMVYDQANSEVRLYADGVQEASAPFLIDRPIGRPADLHIGSFINGGSDFDGDLDFVRISDGALTPAQFVPTTIALQPLVKTLQPANNARNVSPTALIKATFQNRDTAVVLSSLKLLIDGTDVTAGAIKTNDSATAAISYVPAPGLANGTHSVVTIFSDTAVPANSWTNSWSFTTTNFIPVIGFYQLNEKAPGNVADTTAGAIIDFSGNGRNATVTNALPYVAGSPGYGDTSALQFTVGGGPLIIADAGGAFNFPATRSVTLEAIVRTVNIGEASVGSLLAKQGAAPGEWWWRINATGKQGFLVNNGVNGAKSVNGNAVLNDGQWHHLAAIYDATAQQVRVYVDYVLDGSAAAVNAAAGNIGNAKDLFAGAFQNLDREFDGEIDALRVSAVALDPSWFIPPGGVAVPPSQVQLINVSQVNGQITFAFAAETGRSYVVEATTGLGAAWGDVETVNGDGTTKTVSYAITGTQKYFRVRLQ